jgi:hypothetical protein
MKKYSVAVNNNKPEPHNSPEPENSNASNITRIDSEKFRTIVVIITLSKLKP